MKSGKNKQSIIVIAMVASAAIIGVVSFLSSSNNIFSKGSNDITNENAVTNNVSTTTEGPSSPFSKLSVATLTSDSSATLRGNPSAKVTLIEFSDFQCPFCHRFTMQTEPQINQEYIQTSKVNMVFKHLIHIGPDSLTAAEASQCAGEQGKFWQYHDVLYQNQGPENSGWASKENLKNFGSQVGIDKTKFDSCLDSGKYNDFVKNSNYFAASLGLSGTPSFIIVKSDGSDPEKTEGAYPFASFKQVLDKKLAEAGA